VSDSERVILRVYAEEREAATLTGVAAVAEAQRATARRLGLAVARVVDVHHRYVGRL
jgi:hypothetical protein